jgi:RNA polymerase sigma factor (sigma-70 family)
MDRTLSVMDATIERFEQPLIHYATRIVGDRDRAKDVVQDTFLRMFESGKDDDDDNLAPWLYAVCRNRAIDVRRRQSRLSPLEDPLDVAVEPLGERHRAIAEVFALIDALPEGKGKVMRLRFREGQSYRDISHATGMTVNHIGVVIHSTVRHLRERVAIVAALVLVAGMIGHHMAEPELQTLEPVAIALPAPLLQAGPVFRVQPDAIALDEEVESPPEGTPAPLPPASATRKKAGTAAPKKVMRFRPSAL